MVVGTASNAGKSILCTALCRILTQDGLSVAPFKAQNMSLNSAVTPSGREIGRAQAVQAEACGIAPNEHMNPVLLKPTGQHKSQVVLQGRVYETKTAKDYFRERTGAIWDAVVESYTFLSARYDLLVIEGAGSPVEMNLKPRDIANMRTAELADAVVVLVADIDRGGIFASVVGTLQLLNEAERKRVQGIVVNKFRGDRSLFDDGVQLLESYTGIPVLGVIPLIADLDIEEEDSVALDDIRYHTRKDSDKNCLQVVIVQLPHMSNFTDFDPLFLEPSVSVYFSKSPEDITFAHVVILPGTKNTMDDLAWLHQTGWATKIDALVKDGAFVFGICGGYQMLGHTVFDPHGVESSIGQVSGLGYLPVNTTLLAEKATILVQGEIVAQYARQKLRVQGYEIHMGKTTPLAGYLPFASVQSEQDLVGRFEGAISETGAIVGTYLHGILDNDAFRAAWLGTTRCRFGLAPVESNLSMNAQRSAAYDRLAEIVRTHLNMNVLYEAIGIVEPACSGRQVVQRYDR